jgi:signal transduction histidine kinase
MLLNESWQIAKKSKMNAELRKANQAKNDFLSNLSHELKTPMNSIMGYTNILLSFEEDEEKRAMLSNSRLAQIGLLNMINDMLDLSQIESGKMKIIKHPFHLGMKIIKIAEEFRLTVETKQLDFIFEMDEKIYEEVIGDERKLDQILQNILSNALKFTSKGFIKMKVALKAKMENIVMAEIVIKDSGIGIEEEELPKIYDRVYQVEGYMRKRHKGVGMGLSIVREFVELMGGSIKAKSKFGIGTEFIINLPFELAAK